jgi:Tol biopolymer transport system component
MAIRCLGAAVAAGLAVATGSSSAALVDEAGGPYRNGLIAFVRCCDRPATGLYAVRPNGTGERKLFSPVADDAPLTPAWSPGGRLIAFAPGPPRGGIWSMRADGKGLRRVTRGNGDAVFPSWSPSGDRIVFSDRGSAPSGSHDLYVVRVDGRGLRRLTQTRADEVAAAWAPNRGEIVYWRGRDLWKMKADGSGQRLFMRNATAPSWSPGGSHVAFIRGGDPWVAARDGTFAKRVVDLREPQASLAWSPDGVGFVTAPAERGDLTRVRADGSALRALTDAPGFAHSWPSWQRLP